MFKDLTQEERKTLIAWAIIGVLIFIIAIIFKVEFIDKNNSNVTLDKKFVVVKDYDRYYTVMGAVTKYYEYMNSKDYDSILKIFSEDYKKEEKIKKDNVKKFISKSDVNLSFKSYIMCKKTIDEGITEYMVEGDEMEQNTGKKVRTKYYKIILNEKDMTFAIEPISKKLYGGECHE